MRKWRSMLTLDTYLVLFVLVHSPRSLVVASLPALTWQTCTSVCPLSPSPSACLVPAVAIIRRPVPISPASSAGQLHIISGHLLSFSSTSEQCLRRCVCWNYRELIYITSSSLTDMTEHRRKSRGSLRTVDRVGGADKIRLI